MLFAEYDKEEALRIAKEEAREDGREEGMEKGREEERDILAKEMLRKGAEISFVIGVTKLPKGKIMEFQKELNEEKNH